MGVTNRLLLCRACNGRLAGDKSPFTSGQGYIYRTRVCRQCGTVYFTKQGPEEVTGIETVEMEKGSGEQGNDKIMPLPYGALAAAGLGDVPNIQ